MSAKLIQFLIEIMLTMVVAGVVVYIIITSISIDDRLNEAINKMNAKVLKLEQTTSNLENNLHIYADRLEQIRRETEQQRALDTHSGGN